MGHRAWRETDLLAVRMSNCTVISGDVTHLSQFKPNQRNSTPSALCEYACQMLKKIDLEEFTCILKV